MSRPQCSYSVLESHGFLTDSTDDDSVPKYDIICIVYDITSKASYLEARQLLKSIHAHRDRALDDHHSPPAVSPVVSPSASPTRHRSASPIKQWLQFQRIPFIALIGNKSDLAHYRAVQKFEAQKICLTNCRTHFNEVSAAESHESVHDLFEQLVHRVRIFSERVTSRANCVISGYLDYVRF